MIQVINYVSAQAPPVGEAVPLRHPAQVNVDRIQTHCERSISIKALPVETKRYLQRNSMDGFP